MAPRRPHRRSSRCASRRSRRSRPASCRSRRISPARSSSPAFLSARSPSTASNSSAAACRTFAGSIASNGQRRRRRRPRPRQHGAARRVDRSARSLGWRHAAAGHRRDLQRADAAVERSGPRPAATSCCWTARTPVQLQSPVFSNGNRTVTIRRVAGAPQRALYTLTIRGGQDGPRDEAADLPLLDAFVSTFTTADNIPPAVVGLSPANGERQVLARRQHPRRVLRTHRRRNADGPRTAAGVDRHRPDRLHRRQHGACVRAARLPAGRTRPTSATLDRRHRHGRQYARRNLSRSRSRRSTRSRRRSPRSRSAGRRAPGAQITITPVITGTDVHHVEYLIGSATTLASSDDAVRGRRRPCRRARTTLTIVATAFDEVGNRSSAFTSAGCRARPTRRRPIALRTVLPLTQIGQGQSVEFEAVATDDDRVVRVALSAVGAATFSEVRQAPAAIGAVHNAVHAFKSRPAAPSGSALTAQAVAIDGAEAQSAAATVSLPIVDGVRPTLTVVEPGQQRRHHSRPAADGRRRRH